MSDVLGQAIWDYFSNGRAAKLWIHNKYGNKEEMPVSTYFRNAQSMTQLELTALEYCQGRVLEIGAGAGSHALELQSRKIDVTALDISAKASEVMKLRGVKKVEVQDIFSYQGSGYDTLLLLMNGIGVTANLQRLSKFLQLAKNWMSAKGQLIFDSSDVAYLYENSDALPAYYYGEISYCYEYKRQKSDWFTWLYVDLETLTAIAEKEGWQRQVLFIDEFDQYLVRLTRL